MIKSITKKKVKKASSKKANPKCRIIKARRKISMGKGKRPRILQVKRKVCNPYMNLEYKKTTKGWFVRLIAYGFQDRTDWIGPFTSKAIAKSEAEEMWGES